jgi:spore coat protein U-like protein
MRSILLRSALVFGLVAPTAAWSAACTTSAQAVAFGNYDPLSLSATDSTGQVTVDCTGILILAVTFTVDLSTGVSGSYASRQLASGGNRLNYNLFVDLAHLLVWGNGGAGTSHVTGLFLLGIVHQSANYTVYGRIPARENAAVGSYSDTITVTVTY